MLLILKILISASAGILNALGGDDVLFCRRYIMPVVIAIGVSIQSEWWAGFTVLPVMGTLCIGYKGGKWLVRGAWMAMQAVVIGLGCLLTHHLAWYFYAPYIGIAFLLGATLYDVEQLISDFLFGVFLSTIIFLVH